jgi:predicted O-methyltransferase YrrM
MKFIKSKYNQIKSELYSKKLRFSDIVPHAVYNKAIIDSNTLDNYNTVLLNPHTLNEFIFKKNIIQDVIHLLENLSEDFYKEYTLIYYNEGLKAFGDQWKYADIVTVLFALSKLIQPESYLEIGVRKGRSLAMVASNCPNCKLFCFDLWQENYAGIDNPGEKFVRKELVKVGYRGAAQFINGDSHLTLNSFFESNRELFFDMITVDGDHSYYGAARDLIDVLPKLKIGGVLVFDDISNPRHPYLIEVWNKYVKSNERFSTYEFNQLGYGIAYAIRQY